MRIYALDHVQLSMPPQQEEQARVFYAGVLALNEVPKPPQLAKRGGVWFEAGTLKLHLGVEKEFRPAKKAHPALLVEGLQALIEHCEAAGYPTTSASPLAGYERVHVNDPFGNRIELMELL